MTNKRKGEESTSNKSPKQSKTARDSVGDVENTSQFKKTKNFDITNLRSHSPLLHAYMSLLDLKPDDQKNITPESIALIDRAEQIPGDPTWKEVIVELDPYLKLYNIFSCLYVSCSDKLSNISNKSADGYTPKSEMTKKKYAHIYHLFLSLYQSIIQESFVVDTGESPLRNQAPRHGQQGSYFDQYISERSHIIPDSHKHPVITYYNICYPLQVPPNKYFDMFDKELGRQMENSAGALSAVAEYIRNGN